jgi:hypothetical protein
MKLLHERTCLKCGWVAFGVSRVYAEAEVSKFNDFFDKADAATRESYGNRRSSIANYERCMLCGNSHTNFRDAKPGDCPDGCTMSPILYERNAVPQKETRHDLSKPAGD